MTTMVEEPLEVFPDEVDPAFISQEVVPLPAEDNRPQDDGELYRVVGAHYSSFLFVNRNHLCWNDSSTWEPSTGRELLDYKMSPETRNGLTVIFPHPAGNISEDRVNLIFELLPELIEKARGAGHVISDIVYDTPPSRNMLPKGILFVTTPLPGMVRSTINNFTRRAVKLNKLEPSAIRTAIAWGNWGSKRLRQEYEDLIKSSENNAKFYAESAAKNKEQLDKINRAKELLKLLPSEHLELVMSVLAPKNDPTASLVQNLRYASDYAKEVERTKKTLEGLPIPGRVKKSEVIDKWTLATKDFDIYSGGIGEVIFKFNEPIVLHNGPLSIEYGRSLFSIAFGKPRRGRSMRVCGAKVWSLDKNEFIHPHISGARNYCLGDFPDHMEREYGKGNFHALGMLVWKYLNTYNANSPLISWAECAERMKNA